MRELTQSSLGFLTGPTPNGPTVTVLHQGRGVRPRYRLYWNGQWHDRFRRSDVKQTFGIAPRLKKSGIAPGQLQEEAISPLWRHLVERFKDDDPNVHYSLTEPPELRAAESVVLPAAVRIAEELNIAERGAGFGSAAENKQVEDAAIRVVRTHYKNRRWVVSPQKAPGCGFDLECSKNGATENVEVKGVRGTGQSFFITATEVNAARSNPNFVLMVVTSALSTSPVLTRYSGSEFCRDFTLSVVIYRAVLKR